MAKESYLFGLIGYPLEHSLSPVIHQAALDACELWGDYFLFPVPGLPEGLSQLEELIGRVAVGQIDGLNITIPHKENILRYLKVGSRAAETVRAANTVLRSSESLIAENTDIPGFKNDLHKIAYRHLFGTGFSGQSAHNFWALIIGAGGAARAVVYALLQDGWNCYLCARRQTQADIIKRDFSSIQPGGQIITTPYTWEAISAIRSRVRLVVNTTPLGMAPNIDQNPWPAGLKLPQNAFVYDLVYNPLQTQLLKQAQDEGLLYASGIGMLVEQAAIAFELWTGKLAPREVMMEVALKNL